MLSSKKIILSSALLSASFLAISSTAPAFWCCGDDSSSEESGRTPIKTRQKTAPTKGGSTNDSSMPAAIASMTAAVARMPAAVARMPIDTSAGEQTQPLLAAAAASAAVSTSSSISSELVALSTGASLGLRLKSNSVVVDNHTIQESEEGVKIVTTPTGGIIFVFPNMAYVALQTYESAAQVSYPTRQMMTTDGSILNDIPEDVSRLFVSQAREALRSDRVQPLRAKLDAMILRAMHQQGVQVRSYASRDRTLKEFLLVGSTSELLHVVTGVSTGSEIVTRQVLSQAFRALTAGRAEQ